MAPPNSSSLSFVLLLVLLLLHPCALVGQEQTGDGPAPPQPGPTTPAAPPLKVEVEPTARDNDIEARLERILTATSWLDRAEVSVREGVVFLSGRARTREHRELAEGLAMRTQDVAAVVNNIEITASRLWDFNPAMAGLEEMWRSFLWSLPYLTFSVLILAGFLVAAVFATRCLRRVLRRRISAELLREVLARAAGLIVLLFGLYVVLRVAGLTRLAMTIVGGTGLLGLVLGIAFRDISENFLASVFLSMQRPFRADDLVDIAGIVGYVQRVTTRTTILMTREGNHVQVPNATVYKSVIHNYTSNPNRREDFFIGIGYSDSISRAQDTALNVLADHPAVLKDPEPWVLVDNLGTSTVNLRVYFWLDGSQHSGLKVKSSIIRLVKSAFQKSGISMPDSSRELVFPGGVPVHIIDEAAAATAQGGATLRAEIPREAAATARGAEGGLHSEAGEIQEQARQSRAPEDGQDLLKAEPAAERVESSP